MFAQRSTALEFIDTGDYTPAEYAEALRELRLINRYIGEYHALKSTLLADIGSAGVKEFSVLDIGAGSGELLRLAARFAKENDLTAKLTGLELNPGAANEILAESKDFRNINAVRADALRSPFKDSAFDYAMCSLFTHHLSENDIVKVLKEMRRVARRGIYVIDLHRHPLAYFLYTTVGKLFLKGRLVRHDGALSILRAFKPKELESLARQAGLKNIKISRRFPFRLVLRASAGAANE
jgi:ubiquinone/menaquinone biosynthesis C-methylase UbiE